MVRSLLVLLVFNNLLLEKIRAEIGPRRMATLSGYHQRLSTTLACLHISIMPLLEQHLALSIRVVKTTLMVTIPLGWLLNQVPRKDAISLKIFPHSNKIK